MDGSGYRGLTVWERAMELAEETYALFKLLPADERFGLVSQMQRSAVSVPSNIAEGYARKSKGDYLKHLGYARGSLAELETQIQLAARIHHLDRPTCVKAWTLSQEVGKMLTTLTTNLQASTKTPTA